MPADTLIQLRKGTSSIWTENNPVLASGEPGYDLTNNILKIGDGFTQWSGLNPINLSGIYFNNAVSGLLPVTNIVAGTGISISSSNGSFTINSTSTGGGGGGESSSTTVRGNIIATGTLSSFNVVGGYTIGYLDLFQNGSKLLSGNDFTATDGTSVILTNSVPSGTVLEYISLGTSVSSSNYTKLDSISSSFNGSSTSFGLAVSGTPYYPVSANTLGIYVGGVAQEPIVSYSVSGSNIVFTEAPASGLTFWGVGYGTTAVATLNGIAPGSSGSPSISSSNDLTSGFYFPSSGSLAIASSGYERLRITSSGNVGIGTSSPSGKLHVVGDIIASSGNFSQNLQINGTDVSVSGHTHTSSDITNFNTSVSGLLPITNIIAGSGINVAISGTTAIITSDDIRWNFLLPSAPTALTGTAGDAQVSLTWTAPAIVVPPLTDYVVQYSSDSGSNWTTFSDGTSEATTATVTGLTNGTAYVFRVAGVNGIGTGAYSAASAAVTPTAAAVTYLSGTSGGISGAGTSSGDKFQSISNSNQLTVTIQTAGSYRIQLEGNARRIFKNGVALDWSEGGIVYPEDGFYVFAAVSVSAGTTVGVDPGQRFHIWKE